MKEEQKKRVKKEGIVTVYPAWHGGFSLKKPRGAKVKLSDLVWFINIKI